MRYRALILLPAVCACARPRTSLPAARDLPPLLPLPAEYTFTGGAWNPPAAIAARLADPATADHAELARLGAQLRIAPGGSPESYHLEVTRTGANVIAADSAGLFYGLQTLRQLVESGPQVQAMRIVDTPRFSYRGLHLDVGRHFMPVDFVKRYIDLLSRFKLNTFHWHLTEDQGWRIEIKKYPRLPSRDRGRTKLQSVRRRRPPLLRLLHPGSDS